MRYDRFVIEALERVGCSPRSTCWCSARPPASATTRSPQGSRRSRPSARPTISPSSPPRTPPRSTTPTSRSSRPSSSCITTGDVLNATQQAAFERYIHDGGGYVGIHSAADTEYDWAWYGGLVGAYFQSHPAIQQATIKVADQVHPATARLPERWVRTDEWYNYRTNPRGNVHVLVTLDETTYYARRRRDGLRPPDRLVPRVRGRPLVLHRPGPHRRRPTPSRCSASTCSAASATPPARSRPTTARRSAPTSQGRPRRQHQRPDAAGRRRRRPRLLRRARRRGEDLVRPRPASPRTVGTIPVVTSQRGRAARHRPRPELRHEPLGLPVLFPDARRRPTSSASRGSRSRPTASSTWPPSGSCCASRCSAANSNHAAGSLAFGPGGTLYIATGDNTNPFESDGYAPIDERPGRSDCDAQKSSSNTNDLRGKILRITPAARRHLHDPRRQPVPAGHGQHAARDLRDGQPQSVPHLGGLRDRLALLGRGRPRRAGATAPRAARAATTSINQARTAGNYGWPYFIADNKPYSDYNFATGVSGAAFNPAAPVNNSPNNTGLHATCRPRAVAWIWYPYGASTKFPELGTGGRTAMAGPVYHFDAAGAPRPASCRRTTTTRCSSTSGRATGSRR